MQVKVSIEMGSDGTFGAYIPGRNPLSFGVIGEGETAEEAMQDFLNVVEAYKADGENVHSGLTFAFSYDVPSFLSYYEKRLSLAGLSRITGVAQGQLSHYVTGRRRPSRATVEKMQSSLHLFGKELALVRLL